jgi:hypothetical protein
MENGPPCGRAVAGGFPPEAGAAAQALRRRRQARPAKPRPSRAIEAGSGTALVRSKVMLSTTSMRFSAPRLGVRIGEHGAVKQLAGVADRLVHDVVVVGRHQHVGDHRAGREELQVGEDVLTDGPVVVAEGQGQAVHLGGKTDAQRAGVVVEDPEALADTLTAVVTNVQVAAGGVREGHAGLAGDREAVGLGAAGHRFKVDGRRCGLGGSHGGQGDSGGDERFGHGESRFRR